MASNHTQNYQLNQWEPNDKVLRTDFNADNAKIDAAIKAVDAKADALSENKADKSVAASLATLQNTVSALQNTVSSLQSTVAGKQDSAGALKCAVGSYTGNDAASRTISVGFTPKAVLIFHRGGVLTDSANQYGGLAVAGGPAIHGSISFIQVVNGGFRIAHDNSTPAINSSRWTYHYLAIG